MTPEPLDRILAAHPLTAGMDPDHLAFLAGCASNVRFESDALLVREGDDADATYLVREGRLALEVHVPGAGPRRLGDVRAGELLGWSWLYPPYRWAFDARAVEPVHALRLDGRCLRAKCEGDHDLGYALLKRILRQAHSRLEHARFQALDLYGGANAGTAASGGATP